MAKRVTKPLPEDEAPAIEEAPAAPIEPEPIESAPPEAAPADPFEGAGPSVPPDEPDRPAWLALLLVRGCPACGGNHDGVLLLPLPVVERLDLQHNAFYNCPTFGQRVTLHHSTEG